MRALLDQLTTDEKIAQLDATTHPTGGVDRLGVPAFQGWNGAVTQEHTFRSDEHWRSPTQPAPMASGCLQRKKHPNKNKHNKDICPGSSRRHVACGTASSALPAVLEHADAESACTGSRIQTA